jgi:hypothetical protein
MRAHIRVRMHGIILEDVATDLRRAFRIGPDATSDLVLPEIELKLMAHRDRLVIPGYTTLGAGHSWSLGTHNLTVEVTHLRPQEAQLFEAPIRNIGLLCATASLVVFATFWEMATEFVNDEPEVAVAANALSAQLGLATWVDTMTMLPKASVVDEGPEFPKAVYREAPGAAELPAGHETD